MGKCEGTEKKKKNLQSKGASLPLTGIAEVNLKESRRITQSTSWHTGNNTSLFNHIMFRDACYPSLLYKTDNIQDKFTHVTVIEGLLTVTVKRSSLAWWSEGGQTIIYMVTQSWVGKMPWRKKWQATPVLLLREFHGQRSLVGCSPRGSQRVRQNGVTNTFLCIQSSKREAFKRLQEQLQCFLSF